ncbi:hypothetical protein GCM10020367_23720 [Streptomyces sannanensis]|uniref:Sugar phosphate isomerase/epimerase n=1 Tax=Streptomyces sannanensis TaxID=285536 RepID=A0ABP6SB19_9ACTN
MTWTQPRCGVSAAWVAAGFSPPSHGRGRLGDGAIDLRAWCEPVTAAGYDGPVEVELFHEGLWARTDWRSWR